MRCLCGDGWLTAKPVNSSPRCLATNLSAALTVRNVYAMAAEIESKYLGFFFSRLPKFTEKDVVGTWWGVEEKVLDISRSRDLEGSSTVL